mmetsp:Transcript_99935/g.287264  ORF Transcript_99935/g.287264 Transcript_99935/m.287264 type:complete len:187 (-) Transcript_99935:145-705(-)
MARNTGRLLSVAGASAALLLVGPCFVPGPQAAPAPEVVTFSPALAASAALPVLTMLAEDAEAKYGDSRRWSAVLVPLTTLVIPAVAMGIFTIYVSSDDAFYQFRPGHPRGMREEKELYSNPLYAGRKNPMEGLVNKDDFEKGLDEAWERAKPKGSTVTVKDKLKELSTQNSPHWWRNEHGVADVGC